MQCPKFNKGIRTCIINIAVLPPDTAAYCATSKYVECPFFMIINNSVDACENVKNCKLFKNFQANDMNSLVGITNKYCLTKNKTKCKRYVSKRSGIDVVADLLPDGTFLKEKKLKM